MNTKNNQRFRDTEIRIEAAMLKLLKENEFKTITVKRICETAKVNRSTFYAHFTDIYDMLDKMETYLYQELNQCYEKNNASSDSPLVIFLRHIKKHQYFYRIALHAKKEFPLAHGYEPFWNQIMESKSKKDSLSENEKMYHYIFFQAGFTMILKHWLDRDCIENEIEFAKIIENSIFFS